MNVESKIKNGIVLYFVTNLVQKYIKNKLLLLREKKKSLILTVGYDFFYKMLPYIFIYVYINH